MGMRLHEIHPAVIHAPLALIPTAAVVDVAASRAGRSVGALDRFGRNLWLAGSVTGLLAGLAGMAASQEVKAEERKAQDAMLVHGLGNFCLVAAALGVTLWRGRHRASAWTGGLGLIASGAALYTAYLGGELVYGEGVGVRALTLAPQGVQESPPILSSGALGKLAKDAVRGAAWLFQNGFKLLAGRRALDRGALTLGAREDQRVFAPAQP